MKNDFGETVFLTALFTLVILGAWKSYEIIIWLIHHIKIV